MKKLLIILCITGGFLACNQPKSTGAKAEIPANQDLAKVFEDYFQDGLKFYPLNATYIGDRRYNDLLPNDGSAEFLKKSYDYYSVYLSKVKNFSRAELNTDDQLSYDIFVYEVQLSLDNFKNHFEYMPMNQFYALPITMGQLGAGSGAQPFKTVVDYNDWLKRLSAFQLWTDTAMANFDKGIKTGVVLPKALVVKMIPEMQDLVSKDLEKSLIWPDCQFA